MYWKLGNPAALSSSSIMLIPTNGTCCTGPGYRSHPQQQLTRITDRQQAPASLRVACSFAVKLTLPLQQVPFGTHVGV